MATCIIFGGSGFVGSHFVRLLQEEGSYDDIVVADIVSPSHVAGSSSRVRHIVLDVRTPPEHWPLPDKPALIANFAAVHREPGHDLSEYFETNLRGAENVCAYAQRVQCTSILFTSSIAVYGPTEATKTEDSLLQPVTAYGWSKLAAEKIYLAWQQAFHGRRLIIARPGVLFGPGERGNVTRLVQATLRHYFVYVGNRDTRKAGGYIKEFTRSLTWALERTPTSGGVFLYNFSMERSPTVEEYVNTVCKVASVRRWVPTLPQPMLLALTYVIDALARRLGIHQPINPVRIRKLSRSNDIEPAVMLREGYPYRYTLLSAMADWRASCPEEWT